MNQPTIPSFIKEKAMADVTNVDLVARARGGVEAIEALIKERDEARERANNLGRHYDVNRAKIESLERQNSMLDAKLTYYQNLSTSLLTRLTTIAMTIDDAVREAKEAAARGDSLHTARPGQIVRMDPSTLKPLADDDQARLSDLAKRLAPQPEEPMDLPK